MRHDYLINFLAFSGLGHKDGYTKSRQGKMSSSAMVSSPVRKLHSAIGGFNQHVDTEEATTTSRRRALVGIFAGGAAFVGAAGAQALDMDAFINSQLEADTKNCDPKKDPKCKPQLSEDQALCQYGQSGEARGEACKRVRSQGGSVPKPGSQGKSLGGAYAL